MARLFKHGLTHETGIRPTASDESCALRERTSALSGGYAYDSFEPAMRGSRGAALVSKRADREFQLLFMVMLAIAAGNTALQSVLPAIGRSLRIPDSAIAVAFSVSALIWVLAAPLWANRLDRYGRKEMVLLGLGGFVASLILCGFALSAGILGWIGPLATLGAFVAGRLLYGFFGAAAPPAAQAIVAGSTSRAERTRALTLLASAFGLGTILGPALAPFLLLPIIGLAGPAFIFAVFGVIVLVAAVRFLPGDAPGTLSAAQSHGAAAAYPSIGGQSSGASVTAAVSRRSSTDVKMRDPRIWPWMLTGLIMGHAQAMTGQAIGFLVIDRLGLPLILAQQSIGIVLMTGAGATLLAQWGIIPLLGLSPRMLVISGLAIAAVGTVLTGFATSLHGMSMAFALASLGFGFVRPGYTAGASLAVGAAEQGPVAGRITSVNGAAFVLGPSIGVGLYEFSRPLPYWVAAAALVAMLLYALKALSPPGSSGAADPAR